MNPRLAARAIIVENDRLLMVNAFPGGTSQLWCAPGGGVELHNSLPDTLVREIHEETGLTIDVGAPCLVNEFHDPKGSYHQVEVFFRATIIDGKIDETWQDPENVVNKRQFFTQKEMESLHFRPRSLADIAFNDDKTIHYDPLEPIVI